MNNLILASGSPRRRELLAALGLSFTVQPADVDETLLPNEAPEAAALRLATLKAAAAAVRFPTALTLAADTLVISPAQTILGKPPSPHAATAMLRDLRRREHRVITALTLREAGSMRTMTALTRVRMRDYSDAEIAAYVASSDPLDKAGGYAIQYQDFKPVAAIEGCYTNVVGLPLCLTYILLRDAGLQPDVAALSLCNSYGNICPNAEMLLG